MNPKLTLALVASLTSTAFAAFQAPLPEFKNEKQLAEWRAEKSSGVTSQGYAAEETAFYTGKPYLSSSGGYAFKYRSYNPELARWTSEDPSGFPDGANGNVYVMAPTTQLDALGLDNVTFTGTPESSTTSGSNFNITVVEEAHQLNTSIIVRMVVSWSVNPLLNGWVVQHVQINNNNVYNDADNSHRDETPSISSYWEAWLFDDENRTGSDLFQTRAFDRSTHGSVSMSGKVDFYQNAAFSATNSPGTWSTTAVPAANGLHATTVEPIWWTNSGFNHILTMSWE